MDKKDQSTKTFEWFYFDIHTNDGYDLVITLHIPPFFSLFPIIVWDIFVYKDNKQKLHYFIIDSLSSLSRNENPFSLKAADNYISKNDGMTNVFIQDKNFSLEVNFELKSDIYYGKIVDLLPEMDENSYFKWQVFFHNASAHGILKHKDINLTFSGLAYHDRNYGTINLKDRLASWYWAKVYLNGSFYILGEVILKDSTKNSIVVATDKNISEYFYNLPPKVSGESISFDPNNRALKININESYTIDKFDFYIPSFKNRFISKIREMAFAFSSKHTFFYPLKKKLANAQYTRRRVYGVTPDNNSAEIFQEHMDF